MIFSKERLEAFSDGVIAIIITIMVLSIPLPQNLNLASLQELATSLYVYFVSFIIVGSFWAQHHRIFAYIDKVGNKEIGLNMILLFFMSLIPVFTKWVMENPGSLIPSVCYVVVYFLVYLSFILIFKAFLTNRHHNGIKKMRKAAKLNPQDQNKPTTPKENHKKIRLAIVLITAATLITLYLAVPSVSALFLLGIPVISSITELLFYDYKRRPSQTENQPK